MFNKLLASVDFSTFGGRKFILALAVSALVNSMDIDPSLKAKIIGAIACVTIGAQGLADGLSKGETSSKPKQD